MLESRRVWWNSLTADQKQQIYKKAAETRDRRCIQVTIPQGMMNQVLTLLGIDYRINYPIHTWNVDVFVPMLNLVLECDGTWWHSLPNVVEVDYIKNRWLSDNGFRLIRIWDEDILKDPLGAVVSRL